MNVGHQSTVVQVLTSTVSFHLWRPMVRDVRAAAACRPPNQPLPSVIRPNRRRRLSRYHCASPERAALPEECKDNGSVSVLDFTGSSPCTGGVMKLACVIARPGMALLAAGVISLGGCHAPAPVTRHPGRWHAKYADVIAVPPIEFHYDHGVLAGSYPEGVETVSIRFEDVCAQLGHVCLCGAGGFQIANKTVQVLQHGAPLERGDFILISSRDHAVGDAVAFVLGCVRRARDEQNQHFIDSSIKAPAAGVSLLRCLPPGPEGCSCHLPQAPARRPRRDGQIVEDRAGLRARPGFGQQRLTWLAIVRQCGRWLTTCSSIESPG